MNTSHPLWTDSGTWIAVGVTIISIVVGIAMHRIIKKVLQQAPQDTPESGKDHV